MTDREKLKELIHTWITTPIPPSCFDSHSMAEHFTDYLISKGAVIPVRCEDCTYWDDDNRCNAPINGLVREYTNFDDFCSYGERREDDKHE